MYDDRPVFYYATGTAFTPNYFLANGQLQVEYFPIGADGALMQIAGLGGKIAPFVGGVTNDPFPVLMNADLWNAIKVPYLASAFPMNVSIAGGVDWIVSDIQANLKKGAPWGVGGTSQGAAVASYIYKEIRSGGRLYDWRTGFLSGVCFGNPMRQVNFTNPWSSYSGAFDVPDSTTGGHGSFPASYRLTDCYGGNWIEFTNPAEVITGCGDSAAGQWWQASNGAFLLQSVLAGGAPGSATFNVISFLLGTATSLLSQALSAFFPDFSQTASIPNFIDLIDRQGNPANPNYVGPGAVTDAIGNLFQLPGGGHVTYATNPPYGYAGTESAYQLALSYLDSLAAPFAVSPSVLPPSTTTAGWSTTLVPPAA